MLFYQNQSLFLCLFNSLGSIASLSTIIRYSSIIVEQLSNVSRDRLCSDDHDRVGTIRQTVALIPNTVFTLGWQRFINFLGLEPYCQNLIHLINRQNFFFLNFSSQSALLNLYFHVSHPSSSLSLSSCQLQQGCFLFFSPLIGLINRITCQSYRTHNKKSYLMVLSMYSRSRPRSLSLVINYLFRETQHFPPREKWKERMVSYLWSACERYAVSRSQPCARVCARQIGEKVFLLVISLVRTQV